MFIRDFGTHTEQLELDGTDVKQDMELKQKAWGQELEEFTELFKQLCKCRSKKLEEENEHLAVDVATKQLEMLKRVCKEWKEIAFVTRNKVFKDTEQEDIDLFDIKCKEWGFLLKELFGSSLGTGDYGHLTIDHAPMLLRRFLSMREYSQQGFEASHKDQRQLWLKVSSHDQLGEASSSEQILVHFYAERMLFMRYCIREALKSVRGKTHKHQTLFRFYFRGCGWKAKDVFWDHGEILWLKVMDQLMTMMFGADFLSYGYDRKRNCHVQDEDLPQFVYDMEEWVSTYSDMINENETVKVNVGITQTSKEGEMQTSDDENEFNGGITQKTRETEILISDDENQCVRSDHSDVSVEDATNPKPNSVVAVYPPSPATTKVTILQMDLETVYDGNELNDPIVDFFMMYTADIMGHDVLQKSHLMSSFFFTSLSQKKKTNGIFAIPSAEERYAGASSFTNRVDLFKKDYVFIPVCRSGHWFLAVVYNLAGMTTNKVHHKQAPIIFMVDSLVWGSDFSGTPSSREPEASLIKSFLRCEWQAKYGTGASPKFDENSISVIYPKVPQQKNNYDCGVFVLLFFREFLGRKFPVGDLMSEQILRWYCQDSAQELRRQIENLLLQLGP